MSHSTRPAAAFAFLALIWGYNWVVMKIALQYCGPFEFAVLRVGFGALLLFVLLLALGVPLKPRYPGRTLLLGLFQTTGFVGQVSWSVSLGHAGKSAVLVYTMPFWVILLGWPFLGERLRLRQWFAVIAAFIGLLLVLQFWNSNTGLASSVIAIAAGVSWAISVIIVKKIPVNGRNELLSLTTWQMIFGVIPLIVIAALVPEKPIVWNGYLVGAVIYNAVGGTMIAWILWLYILQHLPATVSGLSALVVPIIGVIAAWLQLGEQPNLAEGAGIFLVLVALGWLALAGRGKPSPKAERTVSR